MADQPNYKRISVSLPVEGWKNLEAFAARINARARTGPRYGRPSWRSWLLRFAMEDIPRILNEMDSLAIHPNGWETIHLGVDSPCTKEEQQPT